MPELPPMPAYAAKGDRSAFFYGTLMAPQVMYRVLHGTSTPTPAQSSTLTIRPALLPGYTRHRVVDCDYPAIVPDTTHPDACVRGTWVHGLTAQDLWRLDIFEGDQYERRSVKCRILAGEETGGRRGQKANEEQVKEEEEALTYVWIEGREMLESREWDFDEFRTEKLHRWIGMEQYGEVDEAVAREVNGRVATARQDPTGGRSTGGEITKKLDEVRANEENVLESAV